MNGPALPSTSRTDPPRSSWRVAALGEADRVQHQLEVSQAQAAATPVAAASAGVAPVGVAPVGTAPVAAAPVGVQQIYQNLDAARAAVGRRQTLWEQLRDWWSGASIETAWQHLHLAQEELVALQGPTELRAQAPYLKTLARDLPADEAKDAHSRLNSWQNEIPDPRTAQRILAAHHGASDRRHQHTRDLRNLIFELLVIVTAVDCAFWGAGVTSGEIVGLGALGGALSVVLAIRAGIPMGPYNLLPAQTLLKVASGGATALMAAKILDFLSGSPATAGRDAVYAIVFGFSQQAFTRLVDQQASVLTRQPDARTHAAATS